MVINSAFKGLSKAIEWWVVNDISRLLFPGKDAVTVLCVCVCVFIYRVSQEECARFRESVPYVKVYRYNPKHLHPKLNGYGDNGQRKERSSCGSTYYTFSADALRVLCACR